MTVHARDKLHMGRSPTAGPVCGEMRCDACGADDALWLTDIVLSFAVCLTLFFVGLITRKGRHP